MATQSRESRGRRVVVTGLDLNNADGPDTPARIVPDFDARLALVLGDGIRPGGGERRLALVTALDNDGTAGCALLRIRRPSPGGGGRRD